MLITAAEPTTATAIQAARLVLSNFVWELVKAAATAIPKGTIAPVAEIVHGWVRGIVSTGKRFAGAVAIDRFAW